MCCIERSHFFWTKNWLIVFQSNFEQNSSNSRLIKLSKKIFKVVTVAFYYATTTYGTYCHVYIGSYICLCYGVF